MNESFLQLASVRQNQIRNAAMKVFSQNPYRKASTDDIAASAGISKGLLFYHFRNKKELYTDLYRYCCERIYEEIKRIEAWKEPDFFERNRLVVEARFNAAEQTPYLLAFGLRAYYETDPAVCNEISQINADILADGLTVLAEGIDTSSFRNREDISRAIKLIAWLGDGLIRERMEESSLDMSALKQEVFQYFELMKHGFYCKE